MLKDKIRYYLMNQNPYVYRDYQDYLAVHKETHWSSKKKTLLKLLKLNVKYRILMNRKKNQLDTPVFSNFFFEKLKEAKLVSFDVFDTLILRKTALPTDVFFLMEAKYDFKGFRNLRIKAELEARKNSKNEDGEIYLAEIYEILEQWTNLNAKEWMRREIEMEFRVCYANPFFKDLYERMISEGKTLLAISDMYLSGEVISEILKRNGYTQIQVYASCDLKKSKASGKLYHEIKECVGIETWIHIGDNELSDVKMAGKCGLEAYLYPAVRKGNRRPLTGMSVITSTYYQAIVQERLYSRFYKDTDYFLYGFVNGGLLACGYCQWLNELCRLKGIEKIFFVSRDGYIINEVYNRFYKQVENEYILFSRFVSQQILFEQNAEEYMDQVVRPRVYSGEAVSIREFLNEVDLKLLEEYLAEYGLRPEEFLCPSVYGLLKRLILDKKDCIVREFEKTGKAAYEYMREKLSGCRNILVVDVGWNGTGALALRYLLETRYKVDVKVYGALIGTRDMAGTDIYFSKEVLYAYCFSTSYNTELLRWHNYHYKAVHDLLVEILFTAPHAGFLKFIFKENALDFLYAEEEAANIPVILEIHKGILEFARLYSEVCKIVPNRVSGRDGYAPIVNTVENRSYCFELFQDYEINELPGMSAASRKTKLGEIMKKTEYIK